MVLSNLDIAQLAGASYVDDLAAETAVTVKVRTGSHGRDAIAAHANLVGQDGAPLVPVVGTVVAAILSPPG